MAACTFEDARAAYNRADYIEARGRGVPRDDTQAVNWYQLAAEGGDTAGQNALAPADLNGRGAQPVCIPLPLVVSTTRGTLTE